MVVTSEALGKRVWATCRRSLRSCAPTRESNPRPLDRKSNALPLRHHATSLALCYEHDVRLLHWWIVITLCHKTWKLSLAHHRNDWLVSWLRVYTAVYPDRGFLWSVVWKNMTKFCTLAASSGSFVAQSYHMMSFLWETVASSVGDSQYKSNTWV